MVGPLGALRLSERMAQDSLSSSPQRVRPTSSVQSPAPLAGGGCRRSAPCAPRMAVVRTMPGKVQMAAAAAFSLALLYLGSQVQRLEESKSKLERAVALHQVRAIEQRHTLDVVARREPGVQAAVADGASSGAGGGVGAAGMANPEEDAIVLYNRVPKTGSTSFTNIAYDLCARNKYHVLHINTSKNNPVMSLQDQARFVKNVTLWKERKPGFYHGHLAFMDFSKFGAPKKPLYINIIRDPIDRLVSYYYFLRFGDDYRPGLRRRKQGDKKTFDECVLEGGPDCAPERLWLQIPFFCGHSAECWNVGSHWALEQAKLNLVNEYLIVGTTEELEDFILMVEAILPRFFKGATELFRKGKRSHLRRTSEKKQPMADTVRRLQQSGIWKLEQEFYEFAREQFAFVRAHAGFPPLGEPMHL
uniref:heparan sulfate 2-O-sulfotransferase 1 isoform X2 n=1 Tax=Myxine glutinosa TaxID=7769 RepID=UPI00358FD20F